LGRTTSAREQLDAARKLADEAEDKATLEEIDQVARELDKAQR